LSSGAVGVSLMREAPEEGSVSDGAFKLRRVVEAVDEGEAPNMDI